MSTVTSFPLLPSPIAAHVFGCVLVSVAYRFVVPQTPYAPELAAIAAQLASRIPVFTPYQTRTTVRLFVEEVGQSLRS